MHCFTLICIRQVRKWPSTQVGIQHGIGDNGKWLCGVRTLLKRSPCVVYSFGSNGETSFEQDILRATKCVPKAHPEPQTFS